MVNDANRASAVIGRVRTLATRAPPQNDHFNINEVILEVISLTGTELAQNNIVLKTRLADHLPSVPGDRIQPQQVLLNLIINAIESLNAVKSGARELSVISSADSSGGICVAVRDTGAGRDPKIVDQLFEPFYTTKDEGIGIGLTISRSIVETHGGRIWASANSPVGRPWNFACHAQRGTIQLPEPARVFVIDDDASVVLLAATESANVMRRNCRLFQHNRPQSGHQTGFAE
jgi:C4-dicarboxylate-specific signal transduction histidine kinase